MESIGLNGTVCYVCMHFYIDCLLSEDKFFKTGNKNYILSSTKFEPNIMRSAFHKSYAKIYESITQFNSYLLTEEKNIWLT